METIPGNKSSSAVAMTASVAALGSKDVLSSVCEDDKERIVVEIVQMYSRQQEKLHSTLHNQLQLEMVRHYRQLEMVNSRQKKWHQPRSIA